MAFLRAMTAVKSKPAFGMRSPQSLRRTRQVQHLRRVKERLARHATAQDAQPAHFVAALDHHRLQSRRRRRARRRVTRAAAADDGDIARKGFLGSRRRDFSSPLI